MNWISRKIYGAKLKFERFLFWNLPILRRWYYYNYYKDGVGGNWEELGQLQFSFMKDQGLKPDHKLLDVGCGSLRGGRNFIRYLNSGNYYGVEKEQGLLDAAENIVIPEEGLTDKDPNLHRISDFNFSCFDVKFDYALAQSVFTHLPQNKVSLCLRRTKEVLRPSGEFYATFKEGDYNLKGTHTGRKGEFDVVYYPAKRLETLAESNGFNFQYVGDWGHPRDQKMARFYSPKGLGED